ncbi:MAG: acetate--CoA ligase family protein [Gammaproteobacteria bacterium]|nr:acetate--CoA ligase family protein [Gammaproteobacteria bacterium]
MSMNPERLRRCLNPASIVVVGGTEAERVLEQSRKLDYQGEMWAVNPRRESMAGIRCLDSLEDLPGVPDVAFVGVPAEPSIPLVGRLNELGAGGAVCLASGFTEVGQEGRDRQQDLVAAAGDMPVLGPNCYGYVNTLLGAALFPDQHGLSRTESGVAIISCSGNIGINFTLQQRGLSIAWLITVGNQAVVGIEEAVSAALQNDRIRAIGIHIEGIRDLPGFVSLADEARQKGIPMVVLKTGKSDLGARITLSHTATLAGEDRLYAALFDRLGVGQVETIEEFLETLKLVSVTGPLKGNRIASMSCSGGEASLIADLSASRAVHFPALEPGHRKRLQATLNEYVQVDNPLDYHTFIWGEAAKMTRTFSTMMEGGFDLTVLVIDYPLINDCQMEDWLVATRAFVEACRRTGSRGAVVTCLSESFAPEIRERLIENGIAPLHGMDQALAAIEAASRIGMAWDDWLLPAVGPAGPECPGEKSVGLDESEAKRLLAHHGIPVPDAVRMERGSRGPDAVKHPGFPLVLKVVSAELAHKSECNAVVVDIRSESELAGHAARLFELSDTLLLETMVEDSVAELLVGVGHDAQFGHYLMLGAGGTLVELLGDREIVLFPLTEKRILGVLEKLGIWPLLNGYRGKPGADVGAVVRTVLAIQALMEQRGGEIAELEVNPLMVKADRHGAVAADALVRMRKR